MLGTAVDAYFAYSDCTRASNEPTLENRAWCGADLGFLALPLIGAAWARAGARIADAVPWGQTDDVAGVHTDRRVLVIGEDMKGRVIPFAKAKGYGYYDPPRLSGPASMEHNFWFIHKKMDEGYTIVDIGPAVGRRHYPRPSSPWYQMELEEIQDRAYPGYVRNWR